MTERINDELVERMAKLVHRLANDVSTYEANGGGYGAEARAIVDDYCVPASNRKRAAITSAAGFYVQRAGGFASLASVEAEIKLNRALAAEERA